LYEKSFIANPPNSEVVAMSKALALVLVFLTASSTILAVPVSGAKTENTWTTKEPMPTPRAALGVAAVNNKIYAIGGANSGGLYPPDLFKGGFLGTNEEYNTVTDTWTSKSQMPTPRDYFAIASFQNKIYCIGGAIGFKTVQAPGMLPGNAYETSRTNEEYDSITDTWITKTPMPVAGMNLQANVIDGKIFVIGTDLTYVYDPITDSWVNKTKIPYSSYSSFSTVEFGKKIVVFGELLASGKPKELVFIYDTENDSWSQSASGPVGVIDGAAAATIGRVASQRIYHMGLLRGAPPGSANQMYDPKTETWTTAKVPPSTCMYFGLAVVNDILFRIGGYNIQTSGSVTPSNSNEQYLPIGYGTPDPYYLLEITPPKISVLSPLNQMYNESSVSLVFNADKAVNWISYSLDGQQNVTITDNTTITNMPNGLHNITVYAQDIFENIGSSQTTSFTITKPEPEAFPIMTVAVVSIVLVAVVVTAGLLVYHKRK
jgi:hypothetical protein